MFATPHTAGGWVGFIVLWTLVAFLARAAWLTATRWWRDRATVDRLGRIPVDPPATPRFTRDPSPRPRSRPEADRDGYYLRRVAEGMEQT
jgi:hypothetical protein